MRLSPWLAPPVIRLNMVTWCRVLRALGMNWRSVKQRLVGLYLMQVRSDLMLVGVLLWMTAVGMTF